MKPSFVLSLFAALAFAACGPHDHASHGGTGAAGQEAGREHAHTERTALGDVKVGEHTISVFQLAKLEAGKEVDFDLDFAPGKPLPGTVRGWIGVESGVGSMKVKFGKETDTRMHGHPEAPSPIPAGSLLWLEIEGAAGTSKGSIACKP